MERLRLMLEVLVAIIVFLGNLGELGNRWRAFFAQEAISLQKATHLNVGYVQTESFLRLMEPATVKNVCLVDSDQRAILRKPSTAVMNAPLGM